VCTHELDDRVGATMTGTGGPVSILRPRPKPDALVRLFCFPYAGAGASAYRAWQAALPPEIDVCAVQPPGRENRFREPAATSLPELVADAGRALPPLLDKPFAFFGHSLGALVAFELARLLRRREGLLPIQLFVSACRAPQRPDPHPPLHGLPLGDFIREVGDRYDAIPAAVAENEELLQLVMPAVKADFEAFETYRYTEDAPLDCPIAALGGTHDHYATQEEIEDWRSQTRGAFRLRLHSGGHFFLQGAERAVLGDLTSELTGRLGAIAGRGSGRNKETIER
jgi:medium-chain acyl-[acyl-carrier-protein] hydrolase